MLNRTHCRTSRIGLGAPLFALMLMGTLFFGCGNDSPQERNESRDTDTSASSKPSDTVASSLSSGADTGLASAATNITTEGAAGVTTGSSTGDAKPTATTVSVNTSSGITTTDRTMSTTATAVKESVGTGEGKPYDPATFDALLRANVANGKVDYNAFKSSAEFANFLQSLPTASLDGMSTNGKLAFWINAYNALVIKNVNDNPGIKQPLDVAGFFDKKKFSVAGKQLTLNQIENDIVRPTFKEPLIHFGLVCAARSCPPLISKAYTEANVRALLAANAEAYLGDSKQNRYDAGTRTLYLSKIFEWYKADFGGNDAGLVDFAKKNGPDAMKSALASASDVKVKFNEYDWTLNKK